MRRACASLAGLAVLYAVAIRPRMLSWGATEEEVHDPFPGAELVPDGRRGATMATTLDARPAQVWPWLVQMGCDRAGWYSWDHLDNGGNPSAERVHSEWQEIAVGDRMLSSPSGATWFEVAALDPQRFLALRASYDWRGHPFDPSGRRPRHFTDSVWSFVLKEIPDDRTRLVVSGYGVGRPRIVQALQNVLFWEPSHWIMQTRQFANLNQRVTCRPS